jgi:hypothetical protein
MNRAFERKAERLLARAEEIAESVETWADFSTAMFDQRSGLIARTFADRRERLEFRRSPQYAAVWQIVHDLIEKFGLIEGATPVRHPPNSEESLTIEVALPIDAVPLDHIITIEVALRDSEESLNLNP